MNVMMHVHIFAPGVKKIRRRKAVVIRMDKSEKDINKLSASLKREMEGIEKELKK